MTTAPTLPETDSALSGAPEDGGTLTREQIRGVLEARDRPPRPSAASVVRTFGWRAMRKIRHVPEQLFDVTLFPIMFTLMFTFLFGGALAGSTEAYVQFLIPGILVQTVMMISMYTGMAINRDIQKGVHDRFRSLPIWQPGAIVGMLLADAFRYTMAATVVVTLGLVLGFRPDGGVLGVVGALALVVLFSFSLSWAWMLLGLSMRSQEAVLNTSMMLLFPLTFISNVFVDPDTLPGPLQAFVSINPVSHLTDASRSLCAGDADGGAILLVVAESVVLVALLAPLVMQRYRREH